jgi:hypothetical protein
MHSLRFFWAVLLLGVLTALVSGCTQQDTERLGRVGRRLAAKTETLTGTCKDGLASSWQGCGSSGDESGLKHRVQERLKWDSHLQGAEIEVNASGSTVGLKGNVRDLTQRRRAVELAETTVGVEKVNDELHMPGPAQ